MISNLLNNAIKFTEEGQIAITTKKRDNEAIISVKDTGTGIHPEIFSKLFSKFVSKSYQGTGLGLFISKSIVEAHGGRIWAKNNPDGKGSRFAFSLPIFSSKTKIHEINSTFFRHSIMLSSVMTFALGFETFVTTV